MKHISHFCPFIDSSDCPGTCRGVCPDGTTVICPHVIETEINHKAYLKDEKMPMWSHLTRVVRDERDNNPIRDKREHLS